MKTRLRTATRALAALAAAGLALAPSAAFAADGSITHVETQPGSVRMCRHGRLDLQGQRQRVPPLPRRNQRFATSPNRLEE